MNLDYAQDAFAYLEGDRLMADGSGEIPEEPYAEGTPLDRAFPESPKANVLAALISEMGEELTESELEQLSGVEGAAEHAEYLEDELGLVEAGEDSYALDTDHPTAVAMGRLEETIIEQDYDL